MIASYQFLCDACHKPVFVGDNYQHVWYPAKRMYVDLHAPRCPVDIFTTDDEKWLAELCIKPEGDER